jgi:hypothetical protein
MGKLLLLVSMIEGIFKYLLLKNSIKHSTNHPLVERIQACTNKGQGHHQWEDNYKNAKYIGVILISSQETHGQKNTDLHESFLTVVLVSQNHGPRGSDGATIWKSIFTSVYNGKKYLRIFDRLTNQLASFNQI